MRIGPFSGALGRHPLCELPLADGITSRSSMRKGIHMTRFRVFLLFFLIAWAPTAFGQAYHPADAYRYVSSLGSNSNDGLSPGTAFATPQHCNAVVVALGGGTCDARTLYNFTYMNAQGPVAVGQHSPQTAVTLLLPPYGTWHCQLTGGTADCLEALAFSSVIGASSGQGNQFVIQADSFASVMDVCGTDPSPVGGATYIHMEGFQCLAQSGATVSGAVVNIQRLFDTSRVFDISATTLSANTNALYVHSICCGASVERVKGDASNAAGSVPCTIGGSGTDGNQGADIGPISCTGPGSGKNAIAMIQGSGQAGSRIHDIYTEINSASDTSTPVIGVTGSSGLVDIIDKFSLGVDAAGISSTRYMVDIGANSSLIIRNLQVGGSGNGINDHNAGRGTISPGWNGVITDYSTENVCCALASYFTSLDASGIKNDKGLQLFDTTASCTTAAYVGATCTTAPITLPVAEPDTNYRVVCTGKGATNVPVVTSTTNSSPTQFTITIAALTAAPASFNSFDCMVGHN